MTARRKTTGEAAETATAHGLRHRAQAVHKHLVQRLAPVEDSILTTEAGLAGEFRGNTSVDGLRTVFDSVTSLLNVRLPKFGRLLTGIPIGPESPATLDLLIPEGAGPFPVLVYFHGGAWVAGSPASHRKLTARFAEKGFLVVSVDYRLAPEHPFPAGLEDCVQAVYWATEHTVRFGGDPARIAIGGDSAGANLACATAGLLAGRLTAPRLSAALLIYGVFDMSDMGSTSANRFIHRAYLQGNLGELLADPRVSPISWAHKLPPSFLVVGTQDSLLAQNRQLRDALAAAQVPHHYIEEATMPHGFMQMEFMGSARRVVKDAVEFLELHMVETPATRRRRLYLRVWTRLRRSVARLLERRAIRAARRWRPFS